MGGGGDSFVKKKGHPLSWGGEGGSRPLDPPLNAIDVTNFKKEENEDTTDLPSGTK